MCLQRAHVLPPWHKWVQDSQAGSGSNKTASSTNFARLPATMVITIASHPRAMQTSHNGRAKRKIFRVRRTSRRGRGSECQLEKRCNVVRNHRDGQDLPAYTPSASLRAAFKPFTTWKARVLWSTLQERSPGRSAKPAMYASRRRRRDTGRLVGYGA